MQVELLERMMKVVNLSFQAFMIVVLLAFVIGMIVGAALAHSRGDHDTSKSRHNKSREISIKLTEEQLEKRKRLDDKDVLDLTKWKPPSDSEIDWSKVLSDYKKKSADKKE